MFGIPFAIGEISKFLTAAMPTFFPDAEERRRRELAKALKNAAKAREHLDAVIRKYYPENSQREAVETQ